MPKHEQGNSCIPVDDVIFEQSLPADVCMEPISRFSDQAVVPQSSAQTIADSGSHRPSSLVSQLRFVLFLDPGTTDYFHWISQLSNALEALTLQPSFQDGTKGELSLVFDLISERIVSLSSLDDGKCQHPLSNLSSSVFMTDTRILALENNMWCAQL